MSAGPSINGSVNVASGVADLTEGNESDWRGHRSHLDPSQNTSGYSDLSFNSVLTDDSDRLAAAPLTSSAATSVTTPYTSGSQSADLKRGWKVVSGASTEQLPSTATNGSPIQPALQDPLSAHSDRQPHGSASIDAEYPSTSSSLNRIDERYASEGFSASDHRSPVSDLGTFSKRMSLKPKDRIRINSLDQEPDEFGSPTETYPPTTEDDAEAKRVQQNLERWAAEERMKRKAARLSRGNSIVGPPAAGGSLARRLSSLRSASGGTGPRLGAGPSSEHLAGSTVSSPVVSHSPNLPFGRNCSRPTSVSSMDSGATNDDTGRGLFGHDGLASGRATSGGSRNSTLAGSRSYDSSALEDVPENEPDNQGKGKKPIVDPFRDPSSTESDPYAAKRRSAKPMPTAFRPIVTVGRASSIQRRAIEAGLADRGKGKGKGRSMPSIVATDTEAGLYDDRQGNSRSKNGSQGASNPFASAEDGLHGSGSSSEVCTANGGVSTTLHHGGLDEEVALELEGQRNRSAGATKGVQDEADLGESMLGMKLAPQSSRQSTSSSKFKELGITEGDDWIDSMKKSSAASNGRNSNGNATRRSRQDEDEAPRRSWWTEWLCGCMRADDDEEQAGRTNPME